MKRLEDITGNTYGKWYVVGWNSEIGKYEVRCECGTTSYVLAHNLINGKSAMCMRCRSRKPRNVKTHHMSNTRTYKSWDSMKTRCSTKDEHHYRNYGGRGVTICDRWINSFEIFLEDMGERPEGMTLDRIDVNGNYEPSNCRWATRKEQANNTTRNVKIEYNNLVLSVSEFSKSIDKNIGVVRSRLSAGWPIDKIVSTPIDESKSSICRRT